MTIKYKRYDPLKKATIQHIVLDVDHVSCHAHHMYYWLIGKPKFMFRLNFDEVCDVRIE